MKLERYELKAGRNLTSFKFISQGPRGEILKIVQFTPTEFKNVYNLGFGNGDTETGQVDDLAVSNNGDSEKVLATVVATVYAFTTKYPDSWVFATGSTMARTRLYRMGIAKYLDDAKNDFFIFGQFNGEWELFNKGMDYTAFIFKRKLSKFE